MFLHAISFSLLFFLIWCVCSIDSASPAPFQLLSLSLAPPLLLHPLKLLHRLSHSYHRRSLYEFNLNLDTHISHKLKKKSRKTFTLKSTSIENTRVCERVNARTFCMHIHGAMMVEFVHIFWLNQITRSWNWKSWNKYLCERTQDSIESKIHSLTFESLQTVNIFGEWAKKKKRFY